MASGKPSCHLVCALVRMGHPFNDLIQYLSRPVSLNHIERSLIMFLVITQCGAYLRLPTRDFVDARLLDTALATTEFIRG